MLVAVLSFLPPPASKHFFNCWSGSSPRDGGTKCCMQKWGGGWVFWFGRTKALCLKGRAGSPWALVEVRERWRFPHGWSEPASGHSQQWWWGSITLWWHPGCRTAVADVHEPLVFPWPGPTRLFQHYPERQAWRRASCLQLLFQHVSIPTKQAAVASPKWGTWKKWKFMQMSACP